MSAAMHLVLAASITDQFCCANQNENSPYPSGPALLNHRICSGLKNVVGPLGEFSLFL